MIKEEKVMFFPFTCDECGNDVEENHGSPIDFLCYSCMEKVGKFI
jgi:hypothetical protein